MKVDSSVYILELQNNQLCNEVTGKYRNSKITSINGINWLTMP